MKDDQEYASLIDLVLAGGDVGKDIHRAQIELSAITKRPLLIYAANVVRTPSDAPVSINLSDDLPFAELVTSIPPEEKAVDILLVTPGGLAQQVSQFVARLRPRFENVGFLLPHMCMSAGTIWALSGNQIWMDERAFLGPIDPQVPGKDGRLVPAQALESLLQRIQETGQAQLKKGENPPWTDIQILHNMDPKEIGNVLSLSRYSVQLAATYLETHKFRDWNTRQTSGIPVSAAEKKQRALEVAEKLCSHEQWKVHSHGISRDVAWNELMIMIDKPESVPGLSRALRRLWALLYWVFENTNVAKVFSSERYRFYRVQPKATQ